MRPGEYPAGEDLGYASTVEARSGAENSTLWYVRNAWPVDRPNTAPVVVREPFPSAVAQTQDGKGFNGRCPRT
jgi:hypothetical protein